MSERPPPAEYLVISRGEWDKTLFGMKYRTQLTNSTPGLIDWLMREK